MVDVISVGICILLLFISFVGSLIGNLLISYTVYKCKSLRTSFNALVMSLALCDLVSTFFCIPLAAVGVSFVDLDDSLCRIFEFIRSTSMMVQLVTVVCIGFERYQAIAKPFDKVVRLKRVRVGIGVSWSLGVTCGVVSVSVLYEGGSLPSCLNLNLTSNISYPYGLYVLVPCGFICLILTITLYIMITQLIIRHVNGTKKLKKNKVHPIEPRHESSVNLNGLLITKVYKETPTTSISLHEGSTKHHQPDIKIPVASPIPETNIPNETQISNQTDKGTMKANTDSSPAEERILTQRSNPESPPDIGKGKNSLETLHDNAEGSMKTDITEAVLVTEENQINGKTTSSLIQKNNNVSPSGQVKTEKAQKVNEKQCNEATQSPGSVTKETKGDLRTEKSTNLSKGSNKEDGSNINVRKGSSSPPDAVIASHKDIKMSEVNALPTPDVVVTSENGAKTPEVESEHVTKPVMTSEKEAKKPEVHTVTVCNMDGTVTEKQTINSEVTGSLCVMSNSNREKGETCFIKNQIFTSTVRPFDSPLGLMSREGTGYISLLEGEK